MLRRKKLIFISISVLIVFITTTNFLFYFLQTNNDYEVTKLNTIEEQIFEQLKTLPNEYKLRTPTEPFGHTFSGFVKNTKDKTLLNINSLNLKELWIEANSWVSNTQLVNTSSPNLSKILFALKYAAIMKTDIDPRGTQLKFLLTLKGGQQAIFKPQWYSKEKIIEGPVYAGKDRFNAEIVAFYLSVILNKPMAPLTVQRTISLKYEVLPVATKRLLNTSFEKNNQICIFGKCFYCKKEDPICDNQDGMVNGAVIFNINHGLNNYRSPWQRTYKKGKKAQWEEAPEKYCRSVRNKLNKKRVYDLIDTAILDFLIQNGDRHHYETLDDTVVWLDNGKGLGNPNIHHIDILAPLYQCCIIRQHTWKTLLNLTGGRLKEQLLLMPEIDSLITEAHMRSIEDRLLIIFATVEYCKNRKDAEHYLL